MSAGTRETIVHPIGKSNKSSLRKSPKKKKKKNVKSGEGVMILAKMETRKTKGGLLELSLGKTTGCEKTLGSEGFPRVGPTGGTPKINWPRSAPS